MRAQDFSHYSQLKSDIDSYIVNLLSDELKSCFNSANVVEYVSCKQGDIALKVEVSIDDRSSTELKMHDICKRVMSKNECGVNYEIKPEFFDNRTFLVTIFSHEYANQVNNQVDHGIDAEYEIAPEFSDVSHDQLLDDNLDTEYEEVQEFPMQVISL